MKRILLFIALFVSIGVSARPGVFSGMLMNDRGEAVPGAYIYWLNSQTFVSSDAKGEFSLATSDSTNLLVVECLSYQTDTLTIADASRYRHITLKDAAEQQLASVEVSGGVTSFLSRTATIQTQQVNKTELYKAACCNLSESFETNASVDVSYSDAATGAKQVRMLGLSGKYVQMLSENTPGVRGLASNYGMEYIPGAWMESIQISKGTSSVINGYEALTGQINVEYLRPKTAAPLALNATVFSNLRAELNATSGIEVGDHASTAIFAHFRNESLEMDENHDGFVDIPRGNQVNLMNKWDFNAGKWQGHLLLRGLYDDRQGGQMRKLNLANPYQIGITTQRYEAFMKNGIVFDDKGTSLGIITSGSYHKQDGIFGQRHYDGAQTNAYLNAIFQTYFTPAHKLAVGASVNFDRYTEGLQLNALAARSPFDRSETTPGLFAEYNYVPSEKLSLMVGLRGDYSSTYGAFVTPRFNIHYAPWKWWSIRGSAGLGYRSPNILSDNSFLLPSSRTPIFNEPFKQERAMNLGLSTVFYIPIATRELQISAEYYYTRFFETVVADMDSYSHQLIFSNLNGGLSYAGSFQVEANMEILRGWSMTAAFRYTDVEQTIGGVLREKPLTNRYKGLISTSYLTRLKKWQFDVTAQFNGGGRMPDPDAVNPLWEASFKPYTIMMAQVTRNFRTWSIYIGGENITNFKQTNPIIAADMPFGPNFDGSMAWGPIDGAKVYVGFRWALDKKEK